MASFEPDLLLLLIGLAAVVLTLAIAAAVLYLWKMLRKEVRWPGLQNPYGWPADMLGDLDSHTVDKSVCKKRLRPSRLEKNAKKFHKTIADVLPDTEPPPVPTRVDSLTIADRRALELHSKQQPASQLDRPSTAHRTSAPPSSSSSSSSCKRHQLNESGKHRNLLSDDVVRSPPKASSVQSSSHSPVRKERKRPGSGYRVEKKKSPRNSFREPVTASDRQEAQRGKPEECAIEMNEDNEPPPPYSEVRRYF